LATFFRDGVTSGFGFPWFNALSIPIRANIVGPFCSTTKSSACIAVCHSGACCSALGNYDVCLGVFERDELATTGQRDRIVKPSHLSL
jgi:hypothetical protein